MSGEIGTDRVRALAKWFGALPTTEWLVSLPSGDQHPANTADIAFLCLEVLEHREQNAIHRVNRIPEKVREMFRDAAPLGSESAGKE